MNGRWGRFFAVLGALMGAAGIAAGAIGAHVLRLEPGTAAAHHCDTAVSYLLLHAVAMTLLATRGPEPGRWLLAALVLFAFGMAGFSGGLLLGLALQLPRSLPTVPWGGSAYLLGWLCVAMAFLQQKSTSRAS